MDRRCLRASWLGATAAWLPLAAWVAAGGCAASFEPLEEGLEPGEESDDDAADDDAVGDDDAGGDDDDAGADDPIGMVDRAYFLDLGGEDFEFLQPAGVGALLQGQIPRDEGLVFAATALDGGALEVRIGATMVANPDDPPADWVWVQVDEPTDELAGVWSPPWFGVGPFSRTVTINGWDVWFGEVLVSGTYRADGSAVIETHVEFTLDAVDLAEATGLDLCALDGCIPCPVDCPHQGENCVRMVSDFGTCPALDDLALEPIP